MKRNILLIISLLFATFMNAAVSKTVNVTTAGTLRTLLLTTEMTSVTDLTVTGNIDAQDFKFIRDGISNLAVLDISAVTIQAYNGAGGTSTATSYPANELPEYSFNNLSKLKSVIFPYSVTSIGDGAFYGCWRITNLSIGNSVTSIGYKAFYGCRGLTSLSIPNSVTSIGNQAFYGCSELTSLSIPNSVTSIRDEAFYGCSGLTSIYSYAITPVVLGSGVFTSVNVYTCILYVPAGSKGAYQAAPIWSDFNIVEMVPTVLPTLVSESVNIYPNPVTEGFQINGLEGSSTLTFTDLSGKVLLTKQVETNDYIYVDYLPKGVYIVKITTANGTIERKVIKK